MRFELGLDGVTFASKGCKLIGGFYRAAGDSPRPTAVLLHGVPGVEKNLDIAYALRDLGWNCLYFHYRGCWGSEGVYSLHELVEDVRAATEWVIAQPSVDHRRLALLGSSMGGYATLVAGAADSRFNSLAALCPLIDPTNTPLPSNTAEGFARMLNGISASNLKAQWDSLPSILGMAEELRNKSILLATGDGDEDFPPSHYVKFTNALPRIRWERFPDGDHSFSACRKHLVQAVITWLNDEKTA